VSLRDRGPGETTGLHAHRGAVPPPALRVREPARHGARVHRGRHGGAAHDLRGRGPARRPGAGWRRRRRPGPRGQGGKLRRGDHGPKPAGFGRKDRDLRDRGYAGPHPAHGMDELEQVRPEHQRGAGQGDGGRPGGLRELSASGIHPPFCESSYKMGVIKFVPWVLLLRRGKLYVLVFIPYD